MNPADPASAVTWDAESRRRLTARLDSLTVDAPGRWSFAVAEGGSLIAEVDSDLLQPSASTIKVPL
ncbi:MAG TPA: hypothetical protein VK059_00045, partial [Nocardioidaceae bacterium]|nr:hypothetical protein [Nocardioidaceae bacterium]